jgi:putative Holliday junction resolvase
MNEKELSCAKPIPTRIIAIDYGMARIGLAVSDEMKIISTPMVTFLAEKKAELTVAKLKDNLNQHDLQNRYKIDVIVIGFPLLMSGKKGLLADEVTHFAALLKESMDLPVITWDERLTSVKADRSLREGNFSRKKRSQKVDGVAAMIILQNYLDFRTGGL